MRVIICTHFALSSATMYTLFIAPKYENDVYHTINDRDGTAPIYWFPYSRRMIGFANAVNSANAVINIAYYISIFRPCQWMENIA